MCIYVYRSCKPSAVLVIVLSVCLCNSHYTQPVGICLLFLQTFNSSSSVLLSMCCTLGVTRPRYKMAAVTSHQICSHSTSSSSWRDLWKSLFRASLILKTWLRAVCSVSGARLLTRFTDLSLAVVAFLTSTTHIVRSMSSSRTSFSHGGYSTCNVSLQLRLLTTRHGRHVEMESGENAHC